MRIDTIYRPENWYTKQKQDKRSSNWVGGYQIKDYVIDNALTLFELIINYTLFDSGYN